MVTTKLSQEGLRKAAILVSSLDTAARDAVLDQLTPEQAGQVRAMVMEIDDIDQGEQRRVIDEFFHAGPAPGKVTGAVSRSNLKGALKKRVLTSFPADLSDGVELDGRLADFVSRDGPVGADDAGDSNSPAGRPFRFLQETAADRLVRVLDNERPQTIALVLAHLSPNRAGAVLERLPKPVQVEVIHRLVDLEETDEEILREVEEGLRLRLSEQVPIERRRVAGFQAVAGILQAAEGRVGLQILDNLASRDRDLAERLGPTQLTFDDLAGLEARVLGEIFDEAGPELMLPALFGAAPGLINRVLDRIPQVEAEAIRKHLDHPGPIRLGDVEEARRQVARIASRVNYVSRKSREARS